MFINDIFNDNNKKLDEVSNELLGRYKKAAGADASAADKRGDTEQGNKRFKGIVKATIKQGDNDAKKHKARGVAEGSMIDDLLDAPGKVVRKAQDAARGMPPGTVPDSQDDLVNTATKIGKQVIDTATDAARGMPTGTVPKPQKDKDVKEQTGDVPKGWEAKTQADGSTRISKQGSMSSADYKQNMADYKAKNWTPEKIADYSQRMASGQGYTDAERSANYQQQQQHFGQYADKPLDEQRVAEAKADPVGSWVVYDGGKVKRFKSREGAKAYAEKNGGKVASSEFYADNIQKQGVAEGGFDIPEIPRAPQPRPEPKNKSVGEGSVQDKLHKRHQEIRKKAGRPDPDYYKELKTTFDLPDDERWARTAELKKKYKVSEARKSEVNFDIEDIKKLERIRDLPTLKAQAMALISKPSERPMKPEKVAWFDAALDRMDSPMKIIKLMYDLLLSGEGHQVIGSKRSMNPNSYRDRFGESSDGSVKYEFTLADGKKDYQTTRPANHGDKAPVDPNSAAITYKIANPLKKIKSVKVVDKPDEGKSQIKNEDVERYVEELERAGYEILEEKTRLDPSCWKGYRKAGTKMKGDVRVNNCVPVKKKVDEYGAANGPPNLNKSDIKRMMPPEPVAEQIPTITDTGPREQPHPAAQTLDLVRGLKRLAGIDKYDVENAVNQEITNVVRSPQDASSKNVSIINRLFGPRQ